MSINIMHAIGEASLDDPFFVVGYFVTIACAALSAFFAVYWWGDAEPRRKMLAKYLALAALLIAVFPHVFFGIFASLPTWMPGGGMATRFHYSFGVYPYFFAVRSTVAALLVGALVIRLSVSWSNTARTRQNHT